MERAGGDAAAANEAGADPIETLLLQEVARGELPSATWRVTCRGVVVSSGAVGNAVIEPERLAATPDTLYDLASLTKPLVTTTLVLLAVADGRIALDDPIARFVPELAVRKDLAEVSWRDLLAHRAGFEAWYPLYVEGSDRAAYLRALVSRPLAYPARTSVVYSDLGFILLFLALERVWDETLDGVAGNRIFEPLGVERCMFRPPPRLRDEIAATERGNEKEREMVRERGLSFDGWRDGMIRGEVNDCNAWWVGGVSGHAGLFGDTNGVSRLAAVWIRGAGFLPDSLLSDAVKCHAEGGGESRGLGWQLRSGAASPGVPLSTSSFGHSGFTGTSVWIDPAGELVVVLLTNRIHPRVRESRIQEIRRRVNEAAATYFAAGDTTNTPLE